MSNTDFLPEDYKAPAMGGGYAKLKDGENRFRIVSKPIIGWLGWEEKKPLRFKMKDKPERKFEKPIKHFWAFIVWNYTDKEVQILEITQATIQAAITTLSKDEDWGAPFSYDIKIIRKGKDMDTEYSVTPSPKKPLGDEEKKAVVEKPAYLELLFNSEDPWTVSEKKTEVIVDTLPF